MTDIDLNKDDVFLTAKEVSSMLSINKETLRRWDKEGKTKPFYLNPRLEKRGSYDYRGKRYRLKDIEEIIRPSQEENEQS